MTVDELAARAGVTVRTVRFYSTRGLLPPPVLGPRRVGRYGPEHLSRLALIEELRCQGMTLAAIERYLARLPADLGTHDLALHRALVASWAPSFDAHGEVSRAELERRAGRALTDGDLDRLAALDVITRTGAPDTFRVDPGLLGLGIQLLGLPLAEETILAARTSLLEHSRAVAAELSGLFRAEVDKAAGESTGSAGPAGSGGSTGSAEPDGSVDSNGPVESGGSVEPDGSNGSAGSEEVGGSEGVTDPERLARARSLSAHMQPLVVQALVTVFQRSLQQELRGWLTPE